MSLDDCEELAPSLGWKDGWSVAARFAAFELPEIFRADDPAGGVELPVEDRKGLILLVTGLPVDVFIASDSLGWCYPFWQTDRKAEINKSEVPRGADEIAAVTQLFTEDYMVDFLLDNTLGAWHAARCAEVQSSKLPDGGGGEESLRVAGCGMEVSALHSNRRGERFTLSALGGGRRPGCTGVRVRGNDGSTPIACRLSKGLLSKPAGR